MKQKDAQGELMARQQTKRPAIVTQSEPAYPKQKEEINEINSPQLTRLEEIGEKIIAEQKN